MQEIERGDSGVRSTASVQSSLVMYPIWKYGNEEQRQKYLPKLASGEWIGCFGLTEPDHGSNPGGMTTNFKDMGDHYLLNGAKMWISNSPIAQLAVVWAKNEEGRIHGLIVERGMEGFSTPETHNKWSLRASSTGELIAFWSVSWASMEVILPQHYNSWDATLVLERQRAMVMMDAAVRRDLSTCPQVLAAYIVMVLLT